MAILLLSYSNADITTPKEAKKACDEGNARGCTNLGFMYEKGRGVKQDYFKAKELFGKACDGGDAKGCFNLGVMYANGQEVKQDYFKAKELFGKACDGEYAEGCKAYSILNKNKIP